MQYQKYKVLIGDRNIWIPSIRIALFTRLYSLLLYLLLAIVVVNLADPSARLSCS